MVSAQKSSPSNKSLENSSVIVVPSQREINTASGSNNTAQTTSLQTNSSPILNNNPSRQNTVDSLSNLQLIQKQSSQLAQARQMLANSQQSRLSPHTQQQLQSLANSQLQRSLVANSQLQRSLVANSQLQQSLANSQLQQSQLQQSLANSQLQQSQLQQSLVNSQLQQSLVNSQLQQSLANTILTPTHAGQLSSFNTGMLLRSLQSNQPQQPIQLITTPTHSQVTTQLLIEQGMQNPIYGLHYQQIQSMGPIQPSIQSIGGTRQANILLDNASSNLNSIAENAMVVRNPVVTTSSMVSNNRSPISSTNNNRISMNLQNQVAEVGGLRSVNLAAQPSLQSSQLVNLFPTVDQNDGKN
ncbi:92_t:CDS:1 [Acaulospora morrowiae]|uniref:92_t:CDS:1 n=1 Tax=Acaulospora morrowiae TaxID=94023 RepID=A0A9N9H4B5_9GLOM|nr:92_t:CDS:1 [Acaulospora morrowiae]